MLFKQKNELFFFSMHKQVFAKQNYHKVTCECDAHKLNQINPCFNTFNQIVSTKRLDCAE